MSRYLAIFICATLLAACSSAPTVSTIDSNVRLSAHHVDLNNTRKIKTILGQQYKHWRGVPYREGGLSRRGIDCSGLVYLTYRKKFGIAIPRSTEYQSEIGRPVRKRQLRAGDLVFFKTGVFTDHVGIYFGKGRFLHASSSRGVMLSSLHNPYWESTYWQARRVQ